MIYQIVDSYGVVRLEYTDKNKAQKICDSINAMSNGMVYSVKTIGE